MKNFVLAVLFPLVAFANSSNQQVFDRISPQLERWYPENGVSETAALLKSIAGLKPQEMYSRYSFAVSQEGRSWSSVNYWGLREILDFKSDNKEINENLLKIRSSILSGALLKKDLITVSAMVGLGAKVGAVQLEKALSDKKLFAALNSKGALNGSFLPDGQTLLTDAILNADVKKIEKLVSLGALFTAMNQHKLFPLEVALYNGNFDIADKLLDLGADPNQCDQAGRSLLVRYGMNSKIKDDRISAFLKLHGTNVDTKSVSDQIAGPILRSLGVNDDQLSSVLRRVFELVQTERIPDDARVRIGFAAPSSSDSNTLKK